MRYLGSITGLIITCLLCFAIIIQAQTTDFCNGIAYEIDYNTAEVASIDDITVFGRYCFEGRADDVVMINITTTSGDLVLSGALTDRFVDEIYEEFSAETESDSVRLTFTLPDDGRYLILVSREGFGAGTSSGTYTVSLLSDDPATITDDEDSIFPAQLTNFDEDWENTINELQALGTITDNGELIFNLENTFFDGVGAFFTPISRDTAIRDFVVAGELTFTTDSNSLEACSLLARVVGFEGTETFIEVGIDNNGDVFWIDSQNGNMSSGSIELDLDLTQSHHVLFIAQSTYLTIYIDGQRIVDQIEISSVSGSFGIALLGGGNRSRCEGNDVWGYHAPIFIDGLCEVIASTTINQRASATVNSEQVGSIVAGEYADVRSSVLDEQGIIWYQLSDDSFVREDVVELIGDCANLLLDE